MKLTDTTVRNAQPKEKSYKLFDGDGLYIEISPRGHKYWRLKYRYLGKEKRLAIGVYPEISLKKARAARTRGRELLANGIDPSEYKKQQKTAKLAEAQNSFRCVANEWYLAKSPKWSESHTKRTNRLLERDLFPWLGKLPITDIEAPALLDVARRIENRGAIETAHRAIGITGQIFRYAVATGKAKRDPTGDLRGALQSPNKTNFAAITDPTAVGALLRQLDGYEGTLPVKIALQLAPLVFVRPGELRQAKWADIDLDNAEWRFLVTKTKTQHIVPLSAQAVALLSDLRPLTEPRSEFVFPSPRSAKRAMSENAVLSAMRRMGISKDEMSGHGFRAMARTMLDEVLGYRPDYIEHQLAHTVRDPNGRAYNRTAHLAERKKMMQGWADYLDNLKSDSNLISFRQAAGA